MDKPEISDYFDSGTLFARLREEYLHLRYTDDNGEERQLTTNGMILLERFDYWTKDVATAIKEEIDLGLGDNEKLPSSEAKDKLDEGWYFKPFDDIIEDSLLPVSKNTIRNQIKIFKNEDWIATRPSEQVKFNNCKDIRVLFRNIAVDLKESDFGYPLDGQSFRDISP